MNIDQLTLKIYKDIQYALSNVAVHFENPYAKISTINAKIGQISSTIATVDDLTSDLLSKDNGWVIDFEFQPTSGDKSTQSFEMTSMLPWFENLPIKALKGIGKTWQDRFITLNILTIGDLLLASANLIKEMAEEYDSVAPLTFKRMSELLDVDLPLSTYETYSHLTLADLIGDYLKFANDKSEMMNQSKKTADFVNNCLLCIDQDFINKIAF